MKIINFLFNEEKEVEEILKNGFPNKSIDYNKMYLVAKYLREKSRYGEIRLEKELIHFCKEQDKNFNPVIERETIKKWIKSALNYSLRKILSIDISTKEIEFLKNIENERDKKLLFITLTLAKALKESKLRKLRKEIKSSQHYYIRYNNFSDIIKLSGIKNFSEADLAKTFNKYKNYFIFYSPEKEVIQIGYIDKTPQNSITINNPENILEYYNLLFGKNNGKCVICGKMFIKKSNRQKSCPSCSITLERERKNRWKRKQRQ